MKAQLLLLAMTIAASHSAMASMADQMQGEFELQSRPANRLSGQTLWNQRFTDSKSGQQRRCTSCHGDNPASSGKHIKTEKIIKPMASSVNPQRFTQRKKVNKWFKRNCKWTLGRECTTQEKANLLAFLKTL